MNTDKLMASQDWLRIQKDFHWEDPIPGDKWNDNYGDHTVRIGIVGDRILVRIFERTGKQTFPPKFFARLVNRESSDGASYNFIAEHQTCLAGMDALIESHLFGMLRNRIVCSVCGAIAEADSWAGKLPEQLRASNLCFICNEWANRSIGDRSKQIVIEGRMYQIDPRENIPNDCKGHAGGKFIIHYFDGKPDAVTTNLWDCGLIPKEFLHLFPDNAEFVKACDPTQLETL